MSCPAKVAFSLPVATSHKCTFPEAVPKLARLAAQGRLGCKRNVERSRPAAISQTLRTPSWLNEASVLSSPTKLRQTSGRTWPRSVVLILPPATSHNLTSPVLPPAANVSPLPENARVIKSPASPFQTLCCFQAAPVLSPAHMAGEMENSRANPEAKMAVIRQPFL